MKQVADFDLPNSARLKGAHVAMGVYFHRSGAHRKG